MLPTPLEPYLTTVGLGARMIDQVAQRPEFRIGRYHDQERRGPDLADRGQIFCQIERQLPAGSRVGGHRGRRKEQRVTVGKGLGDRLGGHGPARAGPVIDDDLLAKPGGQPGADRARDHVAAAPWREGNEQPDGTVRPGRLRAHAGGQCGGRNGSDQQHALEDIEVGHALSPHSRASVFFTSSAETLIVTPARSF